MYKPNVLVPVVSLSTISPPSSLLHVTIKELILIFLI